MFFQWPTEPETLYAGPPQPCMLNNVLTTRGRTGKAEKSALNEVISFYLMPFKLKNYGIIPKILLYMNKYGKYTALN